MRWIPDCMVHTEEEKTQHKTNVAAEKARDVPAKSTRSQTGASADAFQSVGRLQQGIENDDESISCSMTFSDVTSLLDVVGRCDDESVANPRGLKNPYSRVSGDLSSLGRPDSRLS